MTSLHEAVGHLILGKVQSTSLDADNRSLLRQGTMGGVTLFRENAAMLHQVLDLVQDVRAESLIRPVVTIDQEGGAVQRLDHVIAPLPSMMALARSESAVSDAFEVGKLSGEQLALLGINVVLAPVLDVNTNKQNPIIGSRAFGDDPVKVAALGEALARGYASVGVLPVGKHFPGHGDTSVDSHLQLPLVDHSMERLEACELVPFRRTASFLPGMLTCHVRVPALDEAPLPASLSHKITTRWLRQKLNFEGLVFTDDMLMKAITEHWGIEEACLLAVEAGADQLLVCTTPDVVAKVHAHIVKAVQTGRITQERIQESMDRRARVIASVCDRAESSAPRDTRLLRLRDLIMRCSELTERINLAAMKSSWKQPVPWDDQRVTLIIPDHPRYPMNFSYELKELSHGAVIRDLRYSVNPSNEEITRLAEQCSGHRCVLFTFRAPLNPGQFRLAESLCSSCVPWLVVAVDTPYDLEQIAGWQNQLVLYDPSDFAAKCFAKLVTGSRNALV